LSVAIGSSKNFSGFPVKSEKATGVASSKASSVHLMPLALSDFAAFPEGIGRFDEARHRGDEHVLAVSQKTANGRMLVKTGAVGTYSHAVESHSTQDRLQ
jgi:hypothetical protein